MTGTRPGIAWSIGDDSLDPHQFSDRWFAAGTDRVPEFLVGTDDPAVGWPRIHPGPLNASSGFAPISVTAVFDADHALADAGDLTVAVDVFASHGPCPQLLIEVNGQRGLYFLKPRRCGRADAGGRPAPIAGAVGLRAPLPGGVVREGRNRLTITTVCADDVDDSERLPQRLPQLGTWFGSAITWRRLALLRDPGAVRLDIELAPLPLFVRGADGLAELADLRVRSDGLADGMAELSIAGRRYDVDLPAAGRQFGDVRARFPVADLGTPATATVTVRLGGTVVRRELPFAPCRKWTLHMLPHVHLDVGYTDRPAKVMELHSRNLERAAGILADTPEFRYTLDGSHVLSEFLRTRGGERAARVLAALRDGRLAVNAFSLLFLSGLASSEELFRSCYDALFLREDAGIPIGHAHLTDVPSFSWAIPSVIRDLGLDGFLGIANHTRGGNPDSDELHLVSPVRWQGPDGRDVLAFFADCYTQLRFMCADPPTIAGLSDGLIRYTGRYERDDYLPQDLPVVGTHADNEDLADGYAGLVGRWSERFAYPRIRFSTFGEYLDAVRPLRDRLPVVRGDGGSFWEDGAGTQAVAAATYRSAQVLLPAADALCALVCLAYPDLQPDRAVLDRAWRHLLFGPEHTWSAAHATERPYSQSATDIRDWKITQITNAWRLASDEARRGLSQLAELAGVRGPALVVVNPSSRTRDLTVEHELPVSARPLDTGGAPIPVELLRPPRDACADARFTVRGVPPFGYQVVPLADGGTARQEPWQRGTKIVSSRYTAEVDAGAGRLVSLIHRSSDRQLLDTASPYGLGGIVYVSGGGDRDGRGLGAQATSLTDYDPALPGPRLTAHPCRMRYAGYRPVPGGVRLRFRGSGPTLPALSLDLRLFDGTDRVELTVRMRKEPELAKEAVYVAFPFAVPDPAFRYDRQVGWVEPARDHLRGACNEWFAVQNGAAMTGPAGGVVWASTDAPLVTLDLVRGTWQRQCRPERGTLLSWVMNNYWWTNTPASQEGSLTLRYAFWPVGSWDEAEASALVRDFRAPVLVDEVTEQDRTMHVPPVLSAAGQLISMSVPAGIDARIYSSTRWPGALLVRLEHLGGHRAEAVIRHPHGTDGTAWLGTAAEQPINEVGVDASGQVRVSVGRHQVRTLLLRARQVERLPQDPGPRKLATTTPVDLAGSNCSPTKDAEEEG